MSQLASAGERGLMLAAGIRMRRTLGSKEGKPLQASSEVRLVPACLLDKGHKSKLVRLHQVYLFMYLFLYIYVCVYISEYIFYICV